MKLLNPGGLWLLLLIPVLIIIYLIKNQHEDKAVSSTYIWKLSSKFAKKRLPIQKLRKFILFLLQLLLIAASAIIASMPAAVSGESYDYIAVVDCSASMLQKNEDGVSRFDEAVSRVEDIAEELDRGHTLSVILASDTPSAVVECTSNTNEAKNGLKKAVCTYGGCDVKGAVELAQKICDRTANPKVIFYTDKQYRNTENIEVVCLYGDLWNVSVESLSVDQDDKKTVFTGSLISYNKDASVAVGLKLDGKTVDAAMVECKDGVEQTVEFVMDGKAVFDVAQIYIEDIDGLEADNSYAYCRKDNKKFDVLLISPSPLYLESAFSALGNCNVKVAYSIDDADNAGYDLYVFDGVYPDKYPTDGSVIQFGTKKLPEGLTAGGYFEGNYVLNSNQGVDMEVCKDIAFKGTVVNNYMALISNLEWQSLIECNGSTVLASRKMANGTYFSVFSFDLHNSNLPLKSDYLVLMNNLANHSLPTMFTKTDYTAGETVTVDVLPFTKNLYVQMPDGAVKELNHNGQSCNLVVDTIGCYTAVTVKTDESVYLDFFVHVPKGETSNEIGGDIGVIIQERADMSEDVYSPAWFWIAVAALMVLLAEWGWYYREQY